MTNPNTIRNHATQLLQRFFGHSSFRHQQAEIIEHISTGGDALVLMPTGGGKSLCYQLPALLRHGTGIVVSPLISLMQDQVQRLSQQGIRAALINSTVPNEIARETVQLAFRGELDLLYVAPERLVSDFFLAILDGLYAAQKIALFAIDEAHCITQWGFDFRPEYRQLYALHERYPDVPRVALTATADTQTQREICEQLNLVTARRFSSSFARPNLTYTVTEKSNAKQQLLDFLGKHPQEAGIVYCSTRKKVDEIAHWLLQTGHIAVPYHAGLSPESRLSVSVRFKDEANLIVVATTAFGLGIDRPDIRFVVHLDLPRNLASYYQETGRAGRDGQAAESWMCFGLHDIYMLYARGYGAQQSSTEDELKTLLSYCETSLCRQVALLSHFGETITSCGHCDNCQKPPTLWNATTAAQKVFSAIYRTGMIFGSQHLIDILLGKQTPKVESYRHHELPTFGIGREHSQAQWRKILRQLVAGDYLEFVPDGNGGLRLTASAKPVLTGNAQVWLK